MTEQKGARREQQNRNLMYPELAGWKKRHLDQAHPEHHVHRTVIESITTNYVSDGNGGFKENREVKFKGK